MEIVDLYDKNRIPLNKTMERHSLVPKDCYKLTVFCGIFNTKGDKLLIQKRQSTKKRWPNYWEFSASGSSNTGETSMQAIERELYEELGIKYNFNNIRPILTIHRDDAFYDYYFIKLDVDIKDLKLQESEVSDAKWASKSEIEEMIDKNQFVPYYKSFINLAFDIQDKRDLKSKNNP